MSARIEKKDGVRLSFEENSVTLPVAGLVPLRALRSGTKNSKKYAQILRSIEVIGLVEAPVVTRDRKKAGRYFLLDGHLRVEALKDLGIETVECLVSTDDEAYTYNKRVNRISAVQEHRMIKRAVERGVTERQIADVLGLEVSSVRRRQRMLEGICPDAADVLKDTDCPLNVFDTLRRMAPLRQIEVAELMAGQHNFTGMFAKALLTATPEKLLVEPRKARTSAEQAGYK